MTAFVTTPPVVIPAIPQAKFRIGEREPLIWLVSILFTDEFWQRDSLTAATVGIFNFGDAADIEKSKYQSWPALYEAVENWVKSDETAAACLTQIQQAIQLGELAYYSPEADEWGDKPYHEPERDIDTYQFLLWAERNDYPITKDIIDASYVVIHMAVGRKRAAEEQAYAYPPITAEDFERLKKQPLWRVGSAIMYVIGRRARLEEKEAGFTGNNGLFLRMLQYVLDAYKMKELNVIGYDRSPILDARKKPIDHYMLNSQVKPADFIAWAATLPAELPMLGNEAPIALTALPVAATPEMQLMFAALEHFWSGYDTTKPAPIKKLVTGWLQENASRFGIELSDNLAEAIDTIMRPADARRGGIKSAKS